MLPITPVSVSPTITSHQNSISDDISFEVFLDHLKNFEKLFEIADWHKINFFIDKFLTSKENAREIFKAYQEGLYKNSISVNYKFQDNGTINGIPKPIYEFTNRLICLNKAYSNSTFGIRSSVRTSSPVSKRLTIEKANFLREAFEELVKEETNAYIKVVNEQERMFPIWLG